MNGTFDGKAITALVLGNPNNPACWSSGGTNGSGNGSGRVYRADVLGVLPIDATGHRVTNYTHTVQLRDSGLNGNGTIFLTDGATLVIVYRIQVPGKPHIAPLRSVVLYDGTYTLAKGTPAFTQTVGGFYQAGTGNGNSDAKITPIVSAGASDYIETLTVTPIMPNNVNGVTQMLSTPFTGSSGVRWDSPTLPINLPQDASSYYATVTSGGNQVCLTFAGLVTSTIVTDPDFDGLLTAWEQKGVHLNPGDATHPATFGGCADYASEPCLNLPAMGANENVPDIFVEIDWMHGTDGGDHTHIPKLGALSAIAATFSKHGINIHFDVGNNYQGNSFIVPSAYEQGGV